MAVATGNRANGKAALDPGTIMKLLEEAGLRRDPKILALADVAIRSGSSSLQELLMRIVGLSAPMVAVVHALAPSPGEEVADGDITLGGVQWADGSVYCPARVKADELTGGVLITGATGSGKTRETAGIMRQLAPRYPIWLFDVHEEYHRFFAKEIRSGDVIVLDYKDFRRNLFEPQPGQDLAEAIGGMAAVWRRTTFIRDGGENLLRTVLRELYQEFGVFDGSDTYPCIHDLKGALARMKYRVQLREAEYHSALVNRVEGLIIQLGTTYGCSKGFPIDELLNRSVIFRVGGLDAMSYATFVDDLLTAALTARRLERATTGMLRNVVVIEELHRLTGASPDRSDLSEGIIASFAREARKFGFATVGVDQVPMSIPVPILANMNLRLCLRLNSGADMRAMGDSLGLDPEGRQFLSELPTQTAVVRTGRYPSAFVIQIPDVQQGDISEGEIREATKRAIASMELKERCQPEDKGRPPEPTKGAIPKDEQDYLIFNANHPELPATIKDRRFGASTWKGNALRKALESRGFIRTFKFPTGRKGGVLTLVEITPAGYEHLRLVKAKITRELRGRGGTLHRVGQLWIKQWYERHYIGCEVTIEEETGDGRYVDVSVKIGQRRIAIELLSEGVQKESVNILKVLSSGEYDELVLVATRHEDMERLRHVAASVRGEAAVSDSPAEISYKLLAEFLPERLSKEKRDTEIGE